MKSMLYVAAAVLLVTIATVAWADPPSALVHMRDTVTPLRAPIDLTQRQGWRAVEGKSPLQGDLVVEDDSLTVVFASNLGRVLVYAKDDPMCRAEVSPTSLQEKAATLTHVMVSKGEENPLVVHTVFSAKGTSEPAPITFTFGEGGVLGIWPKDDTRSITIFAPVELALVPSFVGDDLIYDPQACPSAPSLSLVSEHVLLGLLKGGNSELVMSWQDDIPSVRLLTALANPSPTGLSFEGGKGLFLAVLEAPGIWHRGKLTSDYLERDVTLSWTPPFPAIWLTQLYEDEVKTTFEFRHEKEEHWRGGVGFYVFPTWFSGGKTMLTLGKKIPPEGEAVIYCLERGDETPRSVLTPIDVVARTLTGDVLASILDVEGRPAWYPHRPESVIGGATCGVTDALLKIFRAGQEVEKKYLVEGGVEDMYAYLEGMFERNARFYPFAQDMGVYLDGQQKANPELAPWLRELRATAEEIITTYDNARDTIRDISYAQELGAKTVALTGETRSDNLKRMIELKQDWTSMGGALEELARREHTLTRKLYQQAGYGVATRPEAMPIAEEIRKRTKQCLEKPESYEIWANH
jgi:hypothetical protein